MPFWKFFLISFIALLPEEFMWAFAGQKASDLSAIIKGMHLDFQQQIIALW